MAPQAAESLRLTANDLLKSKVVDNIISEPEGGAQNDWDKASDLLAKALIDSLQKFESISVEELLVRRFNKFRGMGVFEMNGGS